MATDAEGAPPLCNRCKEQDGVLDLRSETVCQTCFASFVASKVIKRLEVLQRETRSSRSPSRPQRYLLALSRGPSSTALLHILSENMRRQRERNQRPKYEMVVAFVDMDIDIDIAEERGIPPTTASEPSTPLTKTPDTDTTANPPSPFTDPFTAHFPETTIQTIPLSTVLSSPKINWSSLPPQNTTLPPPRRLAELLARLPTPSARTDVSRLLTRHALFAAAAKYDCPVILQGYNTTALAELTLSEAAKGRGFGIPWLVNDGAVPLPRGVDDAPASDSSRGSDAVYIYSPLREIFRKEILTYLSITSSPAGSLIDLFPARGSSTMGAVVSHRDLSLDDVVSRYFVDVEASYPSVVANVVRTTGKLNRAAPGDGSAAAVERLCGLCGVGLDPLGDERWKGELGEADAVLVGRGRGRLCYGCERSVKG